MFKKIIVAIDGLDGGYDALALADAFAGDRPDAEVILLSAFPYESRRTRASVEGFDELIRDESAKMLTEVLTESGHADDSRYSRRGVPDYSPARALHETAEREGADLIVVGSCHRGLLGRVLVGDVSRATLHGSPVPVAVAPKGYRSSSGGPFELIGVGVNWSPEAEAALDVARELAEEGNGRIELISSVEVPKGMAPQYAYAINWTEIEESNRRAAHERVAELERQIEGPVESHVISGSAGAALETLSEQADLIVTGSRSFGAFRRVVLGSTSDWLAHHASCPLLVVPNTATARATRDQEPAAHA